MAAATRPGSVAQMRRWYLIDGLSVAAIADLIGLTPATTRRRLLAAGVALRTRREQVDFADARAGRRLPSRDVLVAGYVVERLTIEELAVRHQLNPSRIRLLLLRYGVELRPGGQRAELIAANRAASRAQRPVGEFVELYRSGVSVAEIARRCGWNRKVVAQDLRDAGMMTRSLPPLAVWIERYTVGGETMAEIAATYQVSTTAVRNAMRAGGIARRPAVVRHPVVADATIADMYVARGMSIAAIAAEVGISAPLVRAAMARLRIEVRRPVPVDERRVVTLYRQGRTVRDIAAILQTSTDRVYATIRRQDLPPQQAQTELTIPTRTLRRLVAARVTDAEIAARYDVAVWAVVRRRRAEGIRRPFSTVSPPLTRRQLAQRLQRGLTRSEIASEQRVSIATVTRWRHHYSLEGLMGRQSRASGQHGVAIDVPTLRRLYTVENRTIAQVADHFGVDSAIIAFELHSHRIPVRSSRRSSAVIVLDALYGDPDVVRVLTRHGIPLRRRAGRLQQRFARPAALDPELVIESYCDVGLSATHIALVTGHATSKVLDQLRRSGVRPRPGARSPWFMRTIATGESSP